MKMGAMGNVLNWVGLLMLASDSAVARDGWTLAGPTSLVTPIFKSRSSQPAVTREEILIHPHRAALKLFPEEQNRLAWDRGCADWDRHELKSTTHSLVQSVDLDVEKKSGQLRVYATVRILPEPGEDLAGAVAQIAALLGDGGTYPHWVLPGLNEHPEGGRYFVSVDGLRVQRAWHGIPAMFLLTGDYVFEILWFRRDGASSLQLYSWIDAVPPCVEFAETRLANKGMGHKLFYRMSPRAGLLDYLVAEVWVLRRAPFVEVKMRMAVQLARVPYELLPEALVKGELNTRGRRILENFIDYRKARVAAKNSIDSSTSLAPRVLVPKKAEQSLKKFQATESKDRFR